MAQIVGCLEGMGDACRALDFPIVSGNVSASTTKARRPAAASAILPTPAIGGVGLLDDSMKMATIAFKSEGDVVWLLGGDGSHLGQSLWLRELHGREEGLPPPVDLEAERKAGEEVRALIRAGAVKSVHDISDGGLLIALAEMALAGGIGAQLDSELSTAEAFGEDQGRYVIAAARGIEIPNARRIGSVGGDSIAGVSLAQLREASDSFFRDWMGSGAGIDPTDLSGN